MTKQLYLNDTYLFKTQASIIKMTSDEKGCYIILDQTIFYPQGGGQPSDQGKIKGENTELAIYTVRQVEQEIHHYVDSHNYEYSLALIEQGYVLCWLNKDKRLLNARYHTAAHLLSAIVENTYPSLKAIKAHAFPTEAYIEFQGSHTLDKAYLQELCNEAIFTGYPITSFTIHSVLFEQKFYKLPYHIPANKEFRVIQIAGFTPIPCGGTHLKTTTEIGDMILDKIKIKGDKIRISYEVR